MNSTHKVEVVPVSLEPHPNADQLSLVKVFGYVVVVRTEDWKDKNIGAYIPPDSVVPATPYYQFLAQGPLQLNGEKILRDKDRRIKAKKLRGVWSQGMLVPPSTYASVWEDLPVGTDVADRLQITHYEPPADRPHYSVGTKGVGRHADVVPGPALIVGVYDLESWYRFPALYSEGEEIVITEKIHGANMRVAFHNGKLHVGSRQLWKAPEYQIIRNSRIGNVFKSLLNDIFGKKYLLNEWRVNTDWWWTAARATDLANKLAGYDDLIFYGEVYGPSVQDLDYGVDPKRIGLVFFDVRDGITGKYLPYSDARHIVKSLGLDYVPELYRGPYINEDHIRKFIEGQSILGGNHVREGIVIQTAYEREELCVGRLKLKAVNPAYLAKHGEEHAGSAAWKAKQEGVPANA